MIFLIAAFFIICFVMVLRSIQQSTAGKAPGTKAVTLKTTNPQIATALGYAERLFKEHKFVAAEKALLEVIKLDHKNVTAYVRLGKIYLTMKNYPDAIECCQIAAQLAPGAPAYANLGSSYFENKNYIKAIAAYEKAIMFEPSAQRYTGLGRSYLKLSNWPGAVKALEKAVDLEKTKQTQQLLLDAYRHANHLDKARQLQQQMNPSRAASSSAEL